jgi:type II secretory pathway pseudopilin PulG
MAHGRPVTRKHKGFTFVAALLAVALVVLASYGVIFVASTTAKRSKEQALLKVGQAYVDAIAAYYQSSPGTVKVLPQRVDDLLADPRFIQTRHHLRAAYADPIDPSVPLALIVDAQGGIRGVRSQSTGQPLQESPMPVRGLVLGKANTYADWRFEYRVGAANGK